MHYPEESIYLDPDYHTMEEINDRYQHLRDDIKDIDDESGMEGLNRQSYVQPNDVVIGAINTDEEENRENHSYLDVLEYPENSSFTENECVNVIESPSKTYDDGSTTEWDRDSTSEAICEMSDINQQKTATINDDDNSK